MTQAYPLLWPEGWPRTPVHRVISPGSRFGSRLTIAKARDRLLNELRLLGARHVVISSNLKLRNDGLPYSQQPRIEDAGVAVYFSRGERQMAMAHDRWWSPEANINALALAIEGMRQMERHGGAVMVERAFAGFAALPAPDHARHWRTVLTAEGGAKINNLSDARVAYRTLAMNAHPDNGGRHEDMAQLNRAWDDAQKELG